MNAGLPGAIRTAGRHRDCSAQTKGSHHAPGSRWLLVRVRMEARRVAAVESRATSACTALKEALNRRPEWTEIACGRKEFDPPFPFPPRASRGGVGSPHAGARCAPTKNAWHASMLPAPPTRGLPPPCGSPASAVAQTLDRSKQRQVYTENFTFLANLAKKNTEKPPCVLT